MINLHVDYPDQDLDYELASQLALTRAREGKMRQPAIMAWHQRSSHRFSPAFEGGNETSWWAKYGQGQGGTLDVSVGDDYEFILMETGGFETVRALPLRNLRDEAGIEYICLTPMLDDSGRPRRDACRPLDDWAADQY